MSTNSNNQLRSGQIAKQSGQYGVVGPRGGATGREVTVTKGEPMPPTPKPNMGFKLVDATKHGKR
ncbi:hypothetical protein JOD62_001953 [Microbacterium keratanolyticum]|uniref:YjzC family protein n=1 Tax=Microbacterium keratanolyticum TaxID=67574 RepID=A0A9W6HSU3_9MICO|nr:hypothetical protein [Microbacterium keratanolyticum]MBM7469405.1 hypothetical protein [Microbacterium keratanolyticum]GLK01486.1 hypothetical protein GCM10017596_12010 [Microbacterium keratanolyticum]